MNVVKMRGGIGNQMFQYAFGKMLLKNNKSVAYDISWYNPRRTEQSQYPRPFRIPLFKLSEFDIHEFDPANPIIYEKRVGFNPKVFNMLNENNFDGYWQYYSYYESILSDLYEEFQLRTDYYTEEFMKMAERIWNCESVAVHVRRGDYLHQRKGGYGNLPMKYYFNAIQAVKGDLFFFSDDIPWCKDTFLNAYFPNRQITFVDLEDYLCFELMRFCKHQIIPNSTFSWWAALLNDCQGKIVIRPKHFLGRTEKESDEYHYPKHWIKIEDYV